MFKEQNCIKILKKEAMCSNIINKHGAALINPRKGSIILNSTGYNKFITNSKSKISTIHAEIHSVYKYPKKDVKNMDLIVIRVNSNNINGNLKNSRPCSLCIDKLKKLGIRKVYYSNSFGNIVSEYVKNMEKTYYSSSYRALFRI